MLSLEAQTDLRPTALRPTGLWDPKHWDAALDSCARATGLTLAVYAPDGRRVLGPYLHQPIARMLIAAGAFGEAAAARQFERALALRCLESGKLETDHFENTLVLCARPAREGNTVVGALTYGWVYPRFPAPLAAERVSRALGLPINRFWLASREHLPVSPERMRIYEDLLTALSDSLIEQITFRRALVQADRMKDEFLSTLSHELRTPLTSVQLRVQTLARMLPREDRRVAQSLEAIQAGLRSQTRLISDLLDTSRILTGKLSLELRAVDLGKVIQQAAETVAPMAHAKGVQLEVRADHALRALQGDPDRLQQMVWNLLVNGVKFTPEGGRVTLCLTETQNAFEISVSDTGVGIPKTFMPALFDRFAQGPLKADSAQRGLGLGLALVRYIAELHGGAVSAHSDGPGTGATFRVHLPTGAL